MDIINVDKVIKAVDAADDSLIMEGLHGIGKSSVVQQYAEKNGYYLYELFLATQDVPDLIGNLSTETTPDGDSVTTWSKPKWLKRMEQASKEGKRCMLHLDELNRSEEEVRQAMLQTILTGQLHEHQLPITDNQKTLIIASINPEDHDQADYQVRELDIALLSRFTHIKVSAIAETWLELAMNRGVNVIVRDFIAANPEFIWFMGNEDKIGSNPRSLEVSGKYLDNADDIENEVLHSLLIGKLGLTVGSKLHQFYKDYAHSITILDIENLVNTMKEDTDKIEDIAEEIKVLTKDVEATQAMDFAKQLEKKYMSQSDILPFLAYMYSLNPEILIAFVHEYKIKNPEGFKKWVAVDKELNNKQLFLSNYKKAKNGD